MRIVHVITRMILGGAQENTLLTCEGLIRDFGDDVLLVGSGGGSARPPAWCANLAAHGDVETVRAGEVEYRHAERLQGPDRAAAWEKALVVYPGYARYQMRVTREIPVFRLTRRTP